MLAEAERARLQQQNLYLQEEIKSVHNFEEIVGRSPALLAVLDKVSRVAPTDATVLITGETGTGKELIARAIHSNSRRAAKPLIKVNCAALPAGLVESELFGHEKGAFTGAIARRIGRFELADGGTLFLDEIGEFPRRPRPSCSASSRSTNSSASAAGSATRVDVRIIAATNRDLHKAVREKTFREDLYYRLSVFPIALPPLRDRAEDIPLLCSFLVDKFAAAPASASRESATPPCGAWPRIGGPATSASWRTCSNAPSSSRRTDTRPRDRRRTPSPSVGDRRDIRFLARSSRAPPHPRRPPPDPLGHRRTARRRLDSRPASQHAPQPSEEARHLAIIPRAVVDGHDIS